MPKMDTVDRALVLERVTKLFRSCERPQGRPDVRFSSRRRGLYQSFDIALDPASCSIKITNPGLEYLKPKMSEIARRYCSRYPLEPRIKIAQQIEHQDGIDPLGLCKPNPLAPNGTSQPWSGGHFMTGSNRMINNTDRPDHPKSITMSITFNGIRNDDVHGSVLSHVAQHFPEHVDVLRIGNRLLISWLDSRGEEVLGVIEFANAIMQFKLRRSTYFSGSRDIVKFNLGSMAQVLPEKFSERVNSVLAISLDLDRWASAKLLLDLIKATPSL